MSYHDIKNLESILMDYLRTYIPGIEVRVWQDATEYGIRSEVVFANAYFDRQGLEGTRYQHIAESLLEPVVGAVENSAYVRNLKQSYEEQIEQLKEENSKLLEAFTTGEEYLGE